MPKIAFVKSSELTTTAWEGSLAQVPQVGELACLALSDGSVLEGKVLSVTPPGEYAPSNDRYHVVVAG
ncbi:MAG: hypothetical protein WB558_21580 [Terriglobales bacterium]